MGSEPWSASIAYEPSVEEALERLRERTFDTGDFRGSELSPESITEAFENMDASGTCSILDIFGISDSMEPASACRLPDEELLRLFGTTEPTMAMVEANQELGEDIGRGEAVYIVTYANGQPDRYYFMGYSFD